MSRFQVHPIAEFPRKKRQRKRRESKALFKRQVSLGKGETKGKQEQKNKNRLLQRSWGILRCQGWLWGAGAETVGFIPVDRIPG